MLDVKGCFCLTTAKRLSSPSPNQIDGSFSFIHPFLNCLTCIRDGPVVIIDLNCQIVTCLGQSKSMHVVSAVIYYSGECFAIDVSA